MTAFEQAIEMIRETNPDKAELLEAIHRAEVAEAKAAAAEAGQGGGSGDGNQGGKGGKSGRSITSKPKPAFISIKIHEVFAMSLRLLSV